MKITTRMIGTVLTVLYAFPPMAVAQQQPGINIPLPNIPGVTTPQRSPEPPPGYREPYQGDQRYQGGFQQRDTERQRRCEDLSYQEREVRDRLAYAPRSGQEHDDLTYHLGQIHRDQQRCR